jgi:phosphoribosylformylglycinamidine synthase
LGTPITGGNVSLYNETRGEGIYPTPVIGIVGMIDDVTKAVPSGFQKIGDKILLLQSTNVPPASAFDELGSSEYAKNVLSGFWGTVPSLSLEAESALHKALRLLAERRLIHSAADISDGGIATAIAKSCFEQQLGAHINLGSLARDSYSVALFAENASEVLITCAPEDYGTICVLLDEAGELFPLDLGETIEGTIEIIAGEDVLIKESISSLQSAFSTALEIQLDAGVTA